MEQIIPSYEVAISQRIDSDMTGNETKVAEFIEHNQHQRHIKSTTIPEITNFMREHTEKIMKKVRAHNFSYDTKYTFEKMIQIAEGWDPLDIDSLLVCVKKNNPGNLTTQLLEY